MIVVNLIRVWSVLAELSEQCHTPNHQFRLRLQMREIDSTRDLNAPLVEPIPQDPMTTDVLMGVDQDPHQSA